MVSTSLVSRFDGGNPTAAKKLATRRRAASSSPSTPRTTPPPSVDSDPAAVPSLVDIGVPPLRATQQGS
jgi:hypothetical protein